MHTSYMNLADWGLVPSNGLIIVDPFNPANGEALLVDTAWDNDQTEEILDWVSDSLGVALTAAVFTHAHDDKMGGVAAVRARGIPTYAHSASNRIATDKGLRPAENNLDLTTGETVTLAANAQVMFPGGGHTVDNIVVSHAPTEVVFGGCLIRPGGTTSLGNTAEADISGWGASVDRVADAFPEASIIVPSHGPPAGRELFELTRRLADAVANTDSGIVDGN